MPLLECSCTVCHNPFVPSKYSGSRQKVCPDAACRKIAKKQRQSDWQARNPEYFRGPENVERVREWRRNHPDWREKQRAAREARRAKSSPRAKSCNTPEPGPARLQDLAPDAQTALLVGLVALVSGSVLQDEVHGTLNECLRRGGDFLRPAPGEPALFTFEQPTSTHGKTPHRSRADPPFAPAL